MKESQSAISALGRLGIPVQWLMINQCILPEVVEGNRFLAARASLQNRYLNEIDSRFGGLLRSRLPLLDHDVSDIAALHQVGRMLYRK